MNAWRKLIALCLLSSGLLLLGAAAPASAKTFYGDLYLGFSLKTEALPQMAQGMDISSLMSQMTLPFRGKVYFQDGKIRLDADIPSMQDIAGAKSAKDIQSYQVYSVLINLNDLEYLLINHSTRQAVRLRVPKEMAGANPYKDPYALLTSKDFIQGLTQSGNIKYLHTRRLRGRTIEGLKTAGVETTLRMKLPPAELEQMQQLGLNFSGIFTLRLYYELESKFPVLYELDSEIVKVTFQLVNIRRDRLPDVLFEVPAFYSIRDYSVADLEQLLLGVAQGATNFGNRLTSEAVQAPPEQPGETPVEPGAETPPAEGGEAAPPEGGEEAPPPEPIPGGTAV